MNERHSEGVGLQPGRRCILIKYRIEEASESPLNINFNQQFFIHINAVEKSCCQFRFRLMHDPYHQADTDYDLIEREGGKEKNKLQREKKGRKKILN
jgi:hypothetical protein